MNKQTFIRSIALIGILLFCLFPVELKAQNENDPTQPDYKYILSVTPQHLFNRGLRVDLERRLHPSHWLKVGLTGYIFPYRDKAYDDVFFTLFDGDDEFNSMGGGSLEIGYKYLFPGNGEHFYINVGLTNDYFVLRYYGWEFTSFQEYGMTYWENRYGKLPQNIYRPGGNLALGMQTNARKRFFLDGYVGVGYRHAFFKHANRCRFDSNLFSPGYKGFTFLAGIRIGIRL